MTGRATPYSAAIDDGDVQLYHGDVCDVLRSLPAGAAQTCVTSPPYWGLRDYGAAGQIGLEDTPELYVERMVAVFREVWRVLRDDGTLWLNLGDSYAGSWGNQGRGDERGGQRPVNGPILQPLTDGRYPRKGANTGTIPAGSGLKPKDLVGIPWRVAFALQADGWVLRSDVVWAKPNPMPESVTDRPTKAHEMVFLFAKGKWVGPERGRFAHISEEDARWLALLFDTEGNIVIKRAEREGRLQFGAQMAFANCSRKLLEQAQAIVGAGSLHTRSGRNAPVHYWQMTGQQARDLLHRIYPHLIVKQRQARVAIYMQDVVAEPKRRPGGYRTAEHEAFLTRCWETVKALNQFGEPDLSWVPEPRYGRWTSQTYFYDADAVRESAVEGTDLGILRGRANGADPHVAWHAQSIRDRQAAGVDSRTANPTGKRNLRSVWEVATEPFPEAHFATYPQALVRRCIQAGTSERGECSQCGSPWVREVERTPMVIARSERTHSKGHTRSSGTVLEPNRSETTGWRASCSCSAPTRPQTVLDPFIGSGTTALVARKHGRRCIGIDLSADYLEIAARRTQQLSLMGGAA